MHATLACELLCDHDALRLFSRAGHVAHKARRPRRQHRAELDIASAPGDVRVLSRRSQAPWSPALHNLDAPTPRKVFGVQNGIVAEEKAPSLTVQGIEGLCGARPVAQEVTHGAEGRGRADDEHEQGSNDGDKTSHTAFPPCARASQHFVPVSEARPRGKRAVEAGPVEFAHVRTSSSCLRKAACAALRVADTVPVWIPSASPIAAYSRSA